MTSRRDVLKLGAGIAAVSALPYAHAADAKGKTLLILGGTGFIGPHLTTEALRLGWKVTHFNRGKRDADGVSGVETLLGDRKGQLDSLKGRKWDAVVDNTGYVPKFTRQSADLLAPNAGYCLFVSSISAYASFAKPNNETSPTGKLEDINFEEVNNDTYGPMKALCEQYSMDAFKGRCGVVRPGYIVGPLDPTDRFTYWPVRVAKGGEMLAPGTPRDPIQIIDVRDLTAWMMKLVEARTTGYFNAITPARAYSLGDIITASQKESPKAGTKVTWVPEDFLMKQWKPEEVDVPPWSPMKGEYAAASLTSAERAVKSGLQFRDLQTTVHDTMEWWRTLPAERTAKLKAGIDPQKEAATLKAWHESRKSA
jgi:2'-hydroxyisoflavone reductase